MLTWPSKTRLFGIARAEHSETHKRKLLRGNDKGRIDWFQFVDRYHFVHLPSAGSFMTMPDLRLGAHEQILASNQGLQSRW